MSIPLEYVMRVANPAVAKRLREHAEHRLFFALRRFEPKVRRVAVRVVDENGPRKGVDTRCTIQATLADSSRIVVEAITAWPTASVTRASQRLNEAVRRHFGRMKRTVPHRRVATAM